MKIKDVQLEDIDIILEAERINFKEDAFDKDVLISLINNSAFFLKLVDEVNQNEIIGYAIGIQDIYFRVNLNNFLIRKKFQSKGYGSFLLNYVIQEVKKIEGIEQIVLNVNTRNMVAINLYKKFNFIVKDTIKDYYNKGESAYLMSFSF